MKKMHSIMLKYLSPLPLSGRIGFAFSLIEPEEVAFMLDVHMLLGKELDASYNTKSTPVISEEDVKDTFDEDQDISATVKTSSFAFSEQCSYTLETMTPDSVQTGRHPLTHLEQNHLFFFMISLELLETTAARCN